MPPNPTLAALASLRADPRLAALDKKVPPLRLFHALGVARDEVAHSRLLATLIDPRTHAGAETLLRALLNRVAVAQSTPPVIKKLIQSLPASWNRIVIRRELYRVDVIADILAPNGLVVGIENKIDAGEGEDQLNRYQAFLRDRFPKRSGLLLFLTPAGRLPLTADPEHQIPCLAVSYADVLAAIEIIRPKARAEDANTLALVATHLREEIMGEADEIRKAVRELWRDHPEALRRIVECRPQLSEIHAAYKEGLLAVFKGEALQFQQYPERGKIQEVKFWFPSWCRDHPFTFMLYEEEGQLFTRVLIWKDEYDRVFKKLQQWAANVSAQHPGLIDPEFTPLPRWAVWRRVFLEEDWPADAALAFSASAEETVQAAIQRMQDLVARLKPLLPNPGPTTA